MLKNYYDRIARPLQAKSHAIYQYVALRWIGHAMLNLLYLHSE